MGVQGVWCVQLVHTRLVLEVGFVPLALIIRVMMDMCQVHAQPVQCPVLPVEADILNLPRCVLLVRWVHTRIQQLKCRVRVVLLEHT